MVYAEDTDDLYFRGFKGLKQAVKLEYKFGKYDKVLQGHDHLGSTTYDH